MDITIIAGIPDSHQASATPNKDRSRLEFGVPGLLNWLQNLSAPEFSIEFQFNWIWLGGKASPSPDVADRLRRNAIFAVVNPDGLAIAIDQAIDLAGKRPDVQIFNHPEAVLNTRRDKVMPKLSQIDGVDAPTTLRIYPKSRKDVLDAVEAYPLTWPVIFRSSGPHQGKEVVLLHSADDLPRLDQFALDGRAYYLIELKDCRHSSGYFRKFRFVFIGDQIFLRHVISADDWNVHSGSRLLNEETIAVERRYLNGYETLLPQKTLQTLEEIRLALGLDFCGLDCHIAEDGVIVPFEANPAMDIFRNTHPQYDLWDDVLSRSGSALFKLLKRPDQWRANAGRPS